MRGQGRLTKWNDNKGFGFIRPDDSGADIFVHISAFPRGVRPTGGETIVYFAVPNERRKGLRAAEAAIKGAATSHRRRSDARIPSAERTMRTHGARGRSTRLRRLSWSPALILMLAAASFCIAGTVSFVSVNPLPLLCYPVASAIAFLLYAKDKYRAAKGHWRIKESSLHLFEVFGGWPGAFIAQQTMRHKTVKLDYQLVFWAIVAAHVGFWGLWFFAPEFLSL